MTTTMKYLPGHLAAIVWPRQHAAAVTAGRMKWRDAASGPSTAWAMDEDKADRVRVLIAVHDDVIEGAWCVTAVAHHAAIPPGKTRKVNRSHFDTELDSRLDFLVKSPSPIRRRRNPQGVLELRDLPGADVLLAEAETPAHGLVSLGGYVLVVAENGDAELRVPAGAVLSIRTAAADA